ncbi:hypothetical protein [Streptomyces sp. HD]|uniref:hypothetical protein n=1 Tax=Streptomyces sp. HD TaxID=3020892 RepID=UPI00232FEE4F|nr:hypothetical protein [Streptomyces sp. HD]MDC0769079.1 hypothetical protein [Streptomyces sp. HD]
MEGAVRGGRAAEAVTRVGVADTDTPRALFLADELPSIVDVLWHFAGAARDLPGATAAEYTPGRASVRRREPVGAVRRSRRGTTR